MQVLEGDGICIQERALIQFPDGSIRSAQIWQHAIGVRGIYAIAPDEEGQPTWMSVGNSWVVDLWHRLKIALTKGCSKRLRWLNLA